MFKNVCNSKHNEDSIRLNVFSLTTFLFYLVPFFGFIAEPQFKERKCLDSESYYDLLSETAKCKGWSQNETWYHVNLEVLQTSVELDNNDGEVVTRRYKRAAVKPPPSIVNETNPDDSERRYRLFGWPMDERMLKRLEVFITRNFEDFMSRYYDPKGFHGQETHPIYGKFGTRFLTREPLTRTDPYNKLITKLWTRPPNHTWAFTTKYLFTNQTLPPPDTNTRRKLYGWPVDERMMQRLEVFITRKFEDFMSRYYDPKGFHGQETHPIYGKFGTRFITREPITRTDPYNKLITKLWTRPRNHTWAFTVRTLGPNETTNNDIQWADMMTERPKIPRKRPKNGTKSPHLQLTRLFGWPIDKQMYKRLEVFITRKFEDFMSRYYDPEGFHGQETHPIYGKFGTRFLTREPLTRTDPYNKLITKLWTRPPNHTWAFTTKYLFTNQTLPPPDTNTRRRLYGWPVDERMMQRLEVFITRTFEDFMSRYYDPKGFHGQETHPIYGKFGTRFITREPITRTDPYNNLITKVWTRPPNHTWAFTPKTFTTPEFGYYDESEIDSRVLREYEEDKKKNLQKMPQRPGT